MLNKQFTLRVLLYLTTKKINYNSTEELVMLLEPSIFFIHFYGIWKMEYPLRNKSRNVNFTESLARSISFIFSNLLKVTKSVTIPPCEFFE